ncbi:ABC-2 transporter permease [Sporosarcina limicola]|uniref:ABC-type transport system involved in multi-copper enzyme maturation permease subunit n=1 Tax=Sporosarcina limicola TaxID=34101 RepID=A0A927MNY3_9BACL|nr:ABC-2 transporter permease [Sporosarcina limicola]MBE1554681.1 ABC-type transport system involved in multi-copper enzyme maturation permease subunit [Sporosarcina limicola]
MFNLIRKDFVLQKTTLMIMIPVLVVYLFLGTSSIWIGIVFSIVITINAYTIDEKSSINMLLNSLPYTRKEIVSSKYIGAFIFTCLVVFIIFIGNLIIHQEITIWKDILLIVSLVMVAISFIFPFLYKFKSQYMLTSSLVLFAIYLVVITLFIPNLNDKIEEFVQMLLTLQTAQYYLFIALLVMALYACSWLLSIRIYGKKVF